MIIRYGEAPPDRLKPVEIWDKTGKLHKEVKIPVHR